MERVNNIPSQSLDYLQPPRSTLHRAGKRAEGSFNFSSSHSFWSSIGDEYSSCPLFIKFLGSWMAAHYALDNCSAHVMGCVQNIQPRTVDRSCCLLCRCLFISTRQGSTI